LKHKDRGLKNQGLQKVSSNGKASEIGWVAVLWNTRYISEPCVQQVYADGWSTRFGLRPYGWFSTPGL